MGFAEPDAGRGIELLESEGRAQLIIGLVASIPLLWTIGVILAVIGVILALLGG